MQAKIVRLRKKIDKIDSKIARLLKMRLKTVQAIKKVKRSSHLPNVDHKREQEILGKFKTNYEKTIFRKILQESRKLKP